MPECNATFVEIIGGHLNRHPVTGDGSNPEFFHLASCIGDDLVIIFEFNPKARVWKDLGNDTFKL